MGGGERDYKQVKGKLKGSRSNAGRSSTREKSRLGNPNNVVEALGLGAMLGYMAMG